MAGRAFALATSLPTLLAAHAVHAADAPRKTPQPPAPVGDVVRANLEPSYVAYPIGLGGLDPVVFEANVAPHFSLLPRSWHTALFFTPKILIRMFNEASAPVRTPSYMPRVTFVAWLRDRLDARTAYASLMLSHHSNGQAGPFFNADGSINHRDGSFSTNFFDLSVTGVGQQDDWVSSGTLSFEWHPGFNQNQELRGRYGFARFGLSSTVMQSWLWEAKLYVKVAWIADEFERSGSTAFARALEAFPITARYTVRIPSVELGAYAGYYLGHDYYNVWFDRRVHVIELGFAGDLGPVVPSR